jgi:hypothetical protein
VEAFEAGHWLFSRVDGELLVVPRPALCITEGRLHCETGPAVCWPGGARYFFWRGVQVPARVVEDPASLTAREVMRERDVSVRRAMIDRFGVDRLMRAHGTPIEKRSRHDRLWRLRLRDDEPLLMVEVADPSTARRHFLRVPPTVSSPREAVAWTFSFDDAARYAVGLET